MENTVEERIRRYIFVNFGDWRGDIVKLTFWADALERISEQPSKSWVGRWVSVTGLLDPPYKNARWGYSHLSISIHDGGQVNVIDERQSLFRLGKLALVANVERELDVKPISPAQPSRQSSNRPQTVGAKAAAGSKNQELVRKYIGRPAALTQSQATATPSSPVVAASSQSGSQTQAASTTLLNSVRLLFANFKWPVWMLCLGVVFAFANQSSNKQVSGRASTGSDGAGFGLAVGPAPVFLAAYADAGAVTVTALAFLGPVRNVVGIRSGIISDKLTIPYYAARSNC